MNRFLKLTLIISAIMLMASTASAQDDSTGTTATPDQTPVPADTTGTPNQTAPPNVSGEPLPKSVSDHDEQPQVASPNLPAGGLVRQAGVGGVTGYGRAGVLELGGSAGFQFATDYRAVDFSPTIGWFLADNLEISAILNVSNIKAGDSSATLWSALVEPSYHLPFTRSTFAFLGVGGGAAYVKGLGTGLALSPRVGANFLIGRSGVLTPSIGYQYTTHDSQMVEDVTVVALTSSTRFNVGYTAMW